MNVFLMVMHIVCIIINVLGKQYITAMWCLSSLCWFTRAIYAEKSMKSQRECQRGEVNERTS